MKPLLTLVALLAFAVVARATPIDDVKAVMDAPVVFRFQYQTVPISDPARDEQRVSKAVGVPAKSGKFALSPRQLFVLLGQVQGRTAQEMKLLAEIVVRNASALRAGLGADFKSANLISAASDLEEALKIIETTKTLDRAAQDRFARLARVAP